jgi:hypothetical protein
VANCRVDLCEQRPGKAQLPRLDALEIKSMTLKRINAMPLPELADE